MIEPLARLNREVEIHTTDAIMDAYNALESFSACSGIKDEEDPSNSMKAKANHYGHPGFKGSWVPARTYITNAVSGGGGQHKNLPEADVALRKIIMATIQNSARRHQTSFGYGSIRTSSGTTKAFGTTNSPKAVLRKVARQMLENQLLALDTVGPDNTKWTKKKKKARSDKVLVDYGKMRAATRCWIEEDGEELDAE